MTVNGPEDEALDWDAIVWPLHEDNVRRLRRRIFKAAQDGDLAKLRSLQKMMLRSWSSTLVSLRQVTQRNTGRGTAGIDGEVALTAPARTALAVRVHRGIRTWDPRPVKRVYVVRRAALRCIPCSAGRNWRDVPGSDGLPEVERRTGQEHAIEAVAL